MRLHKKFGGVCGNWDGHDMSGEDLLSLHEDLVGMPMSDHIFVDIDLFLEYIGCEGGRGLNVNQNGAASYSF